MAFPKISLNDGVGVCTSVFTAVAAGAAAVSAYYSFSQTNLARQTIAKTEQLAAFDNFAQLANSICRDLDDPLLDKLWDRKRDDFNVNFDISSLEGKEGIDNEKISADVSAKRLEITNRFDDLKFQTMRINFLSDSDLTPIFIQRFVNALRTGVPDIDPRGHGDLANQVRFFERQLLKANDACNVALADLMIGYKEILR